MADGYVRQILGCTTDSFAAFGAVTASYFALRLSLSLLSAFRTFVLSRLSGIAAYLRSKGEWAVVTGATDGIGKEYAFQLAACGMNIVLISRTESKLKDVATEIESKHKIKTRIIAADFSHGTTIYEGIKSKLEGLDIGVLVNNVGLSYEFPDYFLDTPDRDNFYMKLLHVNCTSVTMMSSLVMPMMVAKKKGIVINIASAAGSTPTPLLSVYSACKAYVQFLSECLECEYGLKGVHVQCVNPYFVCSNMSKVRKPSLFIPSARTFVQSALRCVGFNSMTNGYWPHSLTDTAINCLPRSLTQKQMFKTLQAASVRAKRKLASKKDS